MSRHGNRWHNARAETLFGSRKVERLHGRRQATDDVVAGLFWYNRTRLHSTLAYVSSMQFEQDRRTDQSRQASV
jgi:putative transposase